MGRKRRLLQREARDNVREMCSVWVKNRNVQVARTGTLRSRLGKDKWSNGWYGPIFGSTPRSKTLRLQVILVARSAGLEPAAF